MKKIILCVENDIYKTACMKNCAEARFHLQVNIEETSNEVELLEKVIAADADEIYYLPNQGMESFINHLKHSKASRLNTEVRILLCQRFESSISKIVSEAVTAFSQLSKSGRCRLRRTHGGGKDGKPLALIGALTAH